MNFSTVIWGEKQQPDGSVTSKPDESSTEASDSRRSSLVSLKSLQSIQSSIHIPKRSGIATWAELAIFVSVATLVLTLIIGIGVCIRVVVIDDSNFHLNLTTFSTRNCSSIASSRFGIPLNKVATDGVCRSYDVQPFESFVYQPEFRGRNDRLWADLDCKIQAFELENCTGKLYKHTQNKTNWSTQGKCIPNLLDRFGNGPANARSVSIKCQKRRRHS